MRGNSDGGFTELKSNGDPGTNLLGKLFRTVRVLKFSGLVEGFIRECNQVIEIQGSFHLKGHGNRDGQESVDAGKHFIIASGQGDPAGQPGLSSETREQCKPGGKKNAFERGSIFICQGL